MNFLFLGIFPDFSEFILIFNNKNKLKNDKKGFIFRAGPTWMRRGTKGHVAPTWRIIYIIYTYYIYKGSSAFRISEGLLILILILIRPRGV